ncbi:MAG TPA: T9SS type A sorting domain-containing protein, partial [Bacteroidales bacterium]|nr:T9SS type A sorting domain-containing protein [Bacteroidales bacterium]
PTAVADANNCANTATGEATVTVNFAPLAPVQPLAPDTVDHAFVTQSNLSTTAVADATSYVWAIEPETAGSISGNGIDAVVVWTPSYLGTAGIKVAAVNDCGQGEWSLVSDVIVKSTVGVGENNATTLKVYPNPSSGKFTIQLTAGNAEGTIKVTNAIGELVYSEKLNASADQSRSLNLGHLTEGLYMISFETATTVSVQRITIRK